MKITVNDALRLKNEISSIIKNYNSILSPYAYGEDINVNFGDSLIDGEKQEKGGHNIIHIIKSLENLLGYSEEINNTLAEFNVKSKVTNKVRRISNIELMIDFLNNTLKKSEPRKGKNFDKESESYVKTEFIPYLDKSTIKDKMKDLKKEKRELQSEIEKDNVSEIELGFSYQDVEDQIII